MTPQIKKRIEQIRRGEVPEGYKKTKVWIVPDEWEEKKLCSISSHNTRKNTDGMVKITFTNSATQGVIKQTDYFDKEISNIENIIGYYVVQEDDYIYNPRISVSAPCGPINKSHFSENGVVSPLYTVFRMNNNLKKNRYIELYLKSSFWHRYICGVANYGARHDRMNITNDDLFGMPVPFPPLAEQEKIAEILSTQDKLIELKEKLIEKKKRQKKYLMQQLLTGKQRLPGFFGEWRKVLFKECIKEVDDRSTKSNQYPILSVTKNGIVYQADHFNKQIASDNNVGYKIIRRNQLAFSILNLWMGSVDVLNLCDIGIVSPAYKVFECIENYLIPSFAKYFLRSYNVVLLYNKNSETGASVVRKNLDLAALLNEQLEIPSIEEQNAISKILNTADKEISVLQKDLNQEKQRKKALMQLLLTGIVRVTL